MPRVIDRLASLVGAPVRAARFITRGENQMAELRSLARAGRKATADAARRASRTDERLDKQRERLEAVQQQVDDLRRDVSERLRQTNLQLGAVLRAIQQLRASADGHVGDDTGKRLSGRSIPLMVNAEEPCWAPVIGGQVHPDPSGKAWLARDVGPLCGH